MSSKNIDNRDWSLLTLCERIRQIEVERYFVRHWGKVAAGKTSSSSCSSPRCGKKGTALPMGLTRPVPILALGVYLAASPWLYGQIDAGSILGTVSTADGTSVENVQVTILRLDTNETVELLTNQAGYFRWDGLRVGRYQITVSLAGFRREVRQGLTLFVGQSLRADFQLVRGEATEETVSRVDEPLLGEGRTDVGQVIDQEKLEALPVNVRDFGQLAGLAAGAAPSANQRGTVQVMGMRYKDNLTYIDGTLFTHGDGETSFKASTDALQEFDVKTGLYSADYGIRPGGQITAVTKSGSNEFHGNLFWFHRNDNLDARNFFEQRKAEFKRNQLGGTLGGPVLLPGLLEGRDKVWFFFSYQFRSIREVKPLTGVVPTESERRGQFSSAVLDPLTGQSFPEGWIPQERVDPVARKLLPFWPLPNTPGPLNYTSPDSTAHLDNPQMITLVDVRTSDTT